MSEINRRSALILGAVAAGTGYAFAQEQPQEKGEEPVPETPRSDNDPDSGPTANSVLFWNAVALELNAFDHSFVGDEARTLPKAVGPVASARALGLIHAVLADALFSSSPGAMHQPMYNTDPQADVQNPDLFVGGAVSAIMNFIYSTSRHAHLIKVREGDFIRRFRGEGSGEANQQSWDRGRIFGSAGVFRDQWDWPRIAANTLPREGNYIPVAGKHDVDPLNCGQGFYGVTYATAIPPLVISEQEVRDFCAPPPPPDSERYRTHFEEVRTAGRLMGDSTFPNPSDEQKRIGIFWAYDGARFLGTPPRLYNQIILEVAHLDEMDAFELARLLALCNLAMSDAGNVAWYAKYEHKYQRPILGIRENSTDPDWKPLGSPKTNSRLTDPAEVAFLLADTGREITVQDAFLGGGAAAVAASPTAETFAGAARDRCDTSDPAYSSAAFTPNFPAYPSGHATFGAAAFHILKKVRETRPATAAAPDELNRSFVSDELNGSSVDNFTSSRRELVIENFPTISALIAANNDSRVHLGVHWRFDSEEGEKAGLNVANAVFERAYPNR